MSIPSGAVLDITTNKKTIIIYSSDAVTELGRRTLTTSPADWCTESIILQYQYSGSNEWATLTAGTTVYGDMYIRAAVTFGPFDWSSYLTASANATSSDIEIILEAAQSTGSAAFLHCTNDITGEWHADILSSEGNFNKDLPQCINGWTLIIQSDNISTVRSNITMASSRAYAFYYLYYRNV